MPLHRNGAELLFNVVAKAYERQSIIVTFNLQFGQWNTVLGDNRLTAALIDLLVHHAHIWAFDGKSYWLQRALSAIALNPPPTALTTDCWAAGMVIPLADSRSARFQRVEWP